MRATLRAHDSTPRYYQRGICDACLRERAVGTCAVATIKPRRWRVCQPCGELHLRAGHTVNWTLVKETRG